jgi:hypothetical protein
LQQNFEKKLARYALAGSALLGIPAAAHAGTVYSGIIDATATPVNPVAIDITGGSDFSFTLSPDSFGVHITANASTGNFFNDGLTPLAAGTPITLVNTSSTGGELMKTEIPPTGPWASQSGFAYLGLRFTMSSQEYLGWAQIAIDPGTPSLTLHDYAYNDVAGESINAGDGAVPEPSSLALFAMGAAGVVALRQRRKAA